MKKIPYGIEDFKELINHYYYVDKTSFIQDVLNEKLVLYTRPRRFGKTLNMSMLYYFFSVKELANASLFDSLFISKDQEAIKFQNQYPVIFITFKDMKRSDYKSQTEKFAAIISQIVSDYDELLSSTFLNNFQKKLMDQYLNRVSSESDLMDALLNISICLEKHYGKKVIILIDEYDVPLQSAYMNGYYEKMVDFLKNVFSSALKTNKALEKGILTGCLRISKESIFTGLNNFKVNSILDFPSSTAFGFTPEEVRQLLADYQLSDCINEVQEWYDGYLFGNAEIYNPWSTLLYVDRKMQDISLHAVSFWANTSSNDIVLKYIKEADTRLYQEFEQLMQGHPICKSIKPELTYRDMDEISNIYSFLLLTGYLKINKQIDRNTYELVIPNREVYEIYRESFMEYFEHLKTSKKTEFVNALKNENLEAAERILTLILKKSISYYDNHESFYHGFLLGLLDDYQIESNRESGDGRLDLVVYPEIFKDKAIVIECKHSRSEDVLVRDSQEGARQIITRKYLDGVLAKGYQNVVGYGISFCRKKCSITLAR